MGRYSDYKTKIKKPAESSARLWRKLLFYLATTFSAKMQVPSFK